jgi:chromatin segregation and condensation protein Rec8/ScpA/Scc1 (kleisin family)
MKTFSFKSFTQNTDMTFKEQKVYAVISFLAILELIRTGILDVEQQNMYGDMTISKQGVL